MFYFVFIYVTLAASVVRLLKSISSSILQALKVELHYKKVGPLDGSARDMKNNCKVAFSQYDRLLRNQ